MEGVYHGAEIKRMVLAFASITIITKSVLNVKTPKLRETQSGNELRDANAEARCRQTKQFWGNERCVAGRARLRLMVIIVGVGAVL